MRVWTWIVATALALVPMLAVADAVDIPIDRGYVVPAGVAEPRDGAVALRGEPGVEQAVLLYAPVDIDADANTFVTVEHDGLAPMHQLSLYFRAADGEHTVDLPPTTGPVTIELLPEQGWRGRIGEVALVYGPAGNVPTLVDDNTMVVRGLRFEPRSSGASFAAWADREFRRFELDGRSNNVQPKTGLSVVLGALAAVAVLLAVFGGARGRPVGRVLLVAAFTVTVVILARQFAHVRAATETVTDARRAASRDLSLDWALVELAGQLRTRFAGHADKVAFVLKLEDAYAAERLRFHLLPFHAYYRPASALLAGDRCLVQIGDDPNAASPMRVENAFGLFVFTDVSPEPDACRSFSLPRSR